METPLTPGLDHHHQQEEDNKGPVISLRYTVANPGTVMVEGANTAITASTVLGSQRLALQTGPAELGWRQSLLLLLVRLHGLHHLHHPPQLLRLASLDVARVLRPALEVAVPDGDSEEDDGDGVGAGDLRSNVGQPGVVHPHLEPEIDPHWSQAHKPGRDLIKISLQWPGSAYLLK